MDHREHKAGSLIRSQLKNHPDFRKLEVQLKFLNGNGFYTRRQTEVLSDWITRGCGVAYAKKAFMDIFKERGEGDLHATTIYTLFRALESIPPQP